MKTKTDAAKVLLNNGFTYEEVVNLFDGVDNESFSELNPILLPLKSKGFGDVGQRLKGKSLISK